MFGEKKRNFGVLVALIVAITMIIPGTLTIASELNQVENVVANDYYLVKFAELPTDGIKSELTAAFNLAFLEYHQDNTYMVRVPTTIATQLATFPLVSSLKLYTSAEKISPELKGASGVVKLRINIHQGENVEAVASQLKSIGATVTRTNTDIVNYIECQVGASAIPEIASLKQVNCVQINGEKETNMNLITTNTYTGVDAAQTGGFRGSGMLAEVQDNGIDRLHPDLTGVTYTDGTVVADSHGTCTAGIVFGTGAGDINAQGIAYQAVGAFCDWNKGRAASIQRLWTGTFNEGSAGLNGVVQSNSWSQGTCNGQYTAFPAEVDAAMVTYPKVLTLWAAANSNDGTAEGAISQDSASKNSICVGAIFHENTASLADDNYRDDGMGMTPSRGPAADGRMKPDMLAAFDWIYTVDQRGTAGYTTTNYYDNFGGTSGATPTVAGCAVQAYEMYQENYFDNNPTNAIPYASTIKALMIADAYQYPIGVNAITRSVEGWGAPDMENMYNLGATYHVISEYPQALSAGGVWSRTAYSDGTKPLKITLAWTDPAAPGTTGTGRTLINNLDLRVVSPGGTVYWGNMGLLTNIWSTSGTGTNDWTRTAPTYTDDENNVENVFIQTPQVGMWTIEVQGATGDVAAGPQQFSVVASGAMGISSIGSITLDQTKYLLEDTAQVTVQDLDLNTVPTTIQTVNVNVKSTIEPAGETLTLTETGVDTSTFVATIALSATNSIGVIWVANGNTLTATYNDASPVAVTTDTAIIDGAPPAAPTGLTVTWTGTTLNTLVSEDFSSATFPPTGWAVATTGTTGVWSRQLTANAGGTSPEARFMYGTSGTGTSRLYRGPVVTTGLTSVNLTWNNYFNDYAAGVTVRVQTATAAAGPWTNSGWFITSGTGSVGPGIQTTQLTANVGSASLYIAFLVDGDSYQLNYWYLDNVVLTSSSPNTNDNRLNWVKSADDGAGANDVVKYAIYRSNLQTGPWDSSHVIMNLTKGTITYTDPGKGQIDGINWWYVVRAEDDVGNREMNTVAVPEQYLGTMATATGPLGASNVVAVTLTYSYSGTPTSVNIYYTKNGGTTWALAGNDATVDGSFAYTIAAGDGTYGWYASAVGGGSTEVSPPAGGTSPEAASYILDTTPPAVPNPLTVQQYGVISGNTVYDFNGVVVAGVHNAYRLVVGVTTFPPSQANMNAAGTEYTLAQYTPIYTLNAVRNTVARGAAAGQFSWLKYEINGITGTPSSIDLSWTGQFSVATTCQMMVYNFNTATWVTLGSTQAFPITTDGTMANSITATPANYISGGTLRYGIATNIWTISYVDYTKATINFATASTLHNTLNWTHAGVGVTQYNIYRSATQVGGYSLITSVPVGTNTYCDLNRGTADATLWWYIVRAVDAAGNGANSTAVQEPGGTPPYAISLTGKSANSWVFVSFPSAMSGVIQTILNDATAGDSGTTWTVAKWFNAQDKADPWKTYRVGSTVNDMPTMTNTMGVWLWITANGGDQALTLSSYAAYPAASVNINLYTGWNMVGYPSATSRLGTATLPGAADYVSVWQVASPYVTDLAPGAVTMSHGNAYWVRVTADCTWTVQP
jgi:serine protease AprX